MNEKIGLHIIADFYNCDLFTCSGKSKTEIVNKFSNIIKEAGLNELGHHCHLFDTGGFTAVFALAESHLSIHTWTETNYVSIDIFVCNYSKDNSGNAINLYDKIKEVFHPEKIIKKQIKRKLK